MERQAGTHDTGTEFRGETGSGIEEEIGRETVGEIRFEFPDLLFILYLAVILILLLVLGLGAGRVDHPGALIGVHLLLLAAGLGARALPRFRDHPVTRLLRWWYPAILFLVCFEALGHMIHIIRPGLIDAWLVRADSLLFGGYPTLVLQDLARPWLTELMYFCYTSFYLFIPVIGFPLYSRAGGDPTGAPGAPFREFMTAITLVFLGCYLHFLLTPGGGPIFFADYPGPVLHLPGGPVTALEQWLFETGTIVGGAFPSSHVAVALTAAVYAVRFRVMARLFVPLVIGLCISTMYNGYHYGVDVVYGMIVAAVTVLLAPRLLARWERRFERPYAQRTDAARRESQ